MDEIDEVDIESDGSDEDENESQAEESEGENATEDGQWGGIDNEQEDTIVTAGGENTASKRPPTGEEIRIIQDAAELYRSNAFKLQIDALLPNVRPKSSSQPPLDRFLLSLHSFLLDIPPIPPQHPLEASRKLLKKGIAVPYSLPLPTEDTNWKVSFEKPTDILLVGSWANKLSIKAKDGKRFGVDVAVEMPDVCFTPVRNWMAKNLVKEPFPRKRLPERPFLPKASILHCNDSRSHPKIKTV